MNSDQGINEWDTSLSGEPSYPLQSDKSDESTGTPALPRPAPDRTLALDAATSRLSALKVSAQKDPVHSAEALSHRQKFFSIIDSEIVARNPKLLALDALQALLTITANVLNNPGEEKYKSLKLTNSTIQKKIVRVPGAVDYLLACKAAPAVKDHLEYLCFPNSPTLRQREILALGHKTLKERIASRTDAYETEERMLKKEREAEQAQRAKALENIREDRERQRRRQQRESLAREEDAQELEPIQ